MVEDDIVDEGYYGDAIADRTEAFTKLAITAEAIRDRKLKQECMLMLRAVRTSFKTVPQAQLTMVPKLSSVRPA